MPVQLNDSDILFSELIKRYNESIKNEKLENITKNQFLIFKTIKLNGLVDMTRDCMQIIETTGIDPETYFDILSNYDELSKKYTTK